MDSDPFAIHPPQLKEAFNKAALDYDRSAKLIHDVAEQLIKRLEVLTLKPKVILDSGAATGLSARLLEKKYHPSHLIVQDIAENLLKIARRKSPWFSKQRYLAGYSHELPLKNQVVDWVVSNLSLHWYTDVQAVLNEWRRILQPNGVVFFTTLGPDTLNELRESSLNVEEGVYVNRFLEMHHLGDALLKAGFSDPVIDIETYCVNYPNVDALFHEIRSLGMSNLNSGRRKNLTGKHTVKNIKEYYMAHFGREGKCPATFQVVFGHAFVSSRPFIQDSSEISIPIETIRKL
jgi:malonyl-CoA O-methyltransferase